MYKIEHTNQNRIHAIRLRAHTKVLTELEYWNVPLMYGNTRLAWMVESAVFLFHCECVFAFSVKVEHGLVGRATYQQKKDPIANKFRASQIAFLFDSQNQQSNRHSSIEMHRKRKVPMHVPFYSNLNSIIKNTSKPITTSSRTFTIRHAKSFCATLTCVRTLLVGFTFSKCK